MNSKETWFTTSPIWDSPDYKKELLSPQNVNPSPDTTVSEILTKSCKFPIIFPIDTICCQNLIKNFSEEILQRNINSTYPVIHEQALFLCAMFLAHQKKFGNRNFYQNINLIDLIDRFLSKRAICFANVEDVYMLLDGSEGCEGWEAVGTPNEKPPLTIANCLTYDEMKLSAFLSISSHTVFINDGNRRNCGIFEADRKKIEEDGVIIGLIGTRLHKENVMEHREIVKTEEQNVEINGYGKSFVPTLQQIFSNFYGDSSLTYQEMLPEMQTNKERYAELINREYFDKLVYCRRISLSIDTVLIEANERAKNANKMAYVHVVGLGLGVWKIYIGQDKLYMETFIERIKLLLTTLTHISDLCFAYISHKMAGDYKDGDSIGNIKLHMIDKKGPHVKLLEEDDGKLLVVSFAWDSNALPGNEFWVGSLDSSSDPAAASSTQVAELHNWHINPKASARNLRVVTLNGVVTFKEYQEMHKND